MDRFTDDNAMDPGQRAPTGYGPGSLDSEFDQPGPLQAIWQGRWIVLGITVLALVGAYIYLIKADPIYQSTSRIYVEKEGPEILSADPGMVMTRSRNYLFTQVELFMSLPILTMAVERLPVRSMKTFDQVSNPEMHLKSAVLDVNLGKKDEIISVAGRSRYPREAAQIVNALVDAYIEYHGQRKKSSASQVLTILKAEKRRRDQEREKNLQAVIDFKKTAGVLLLESEDQNLNVKRVSTWWDALAQARLEAVEAKAVLDVLKVMPKSEPLPPGFFPEGLQAQRVAARSEYRSERKQLRHDIDDAYAALSRLRVEATDQTPAVIAAKHRITRLNDALQELQKNHKKEETESRAMVIAEAARRHHLAEQRQRALETEIQSSSKDASEASIKQAELAALESAVRNSERLCAALDDRVRELDVTDDTGALNISILDVARPGTNPVEPQRARTMALALVAGLMLGAGLALLKDWMDHRLRSSEEMAQVMGAPVLGVLPLLKDLGKGPGDVGQMVDRDPGSMTSEAFRTVRTAVYFNAEAQHAKTLVVTSPVPGDGKSTVTSNLAIAMAQVGQKILLIDCDFRRPTQHKIFEVQPGSARHRVGLVEVLEEQAEVGDVIVKSQVPGLDVLPCVTDIPNPGEVLNSPQFKRLLEDLESRYDRILLDSPPVMPVADSRILAAIGDAVIVVLRAEKARRKMTELAREALNGVGARVLGVVVNGVPKRKGGPGHYGYYGVSGGDRYENYRYDRNGQEGNGMNGADRTRTRRPWTRQQAPRDPERTGPTRARPDRSQDDPVTWREAP